MTTAPSGWITVPFTELFDIQGGTQPPKSTFHYSPAPNLVRLLQIRDFGDRPVPTYISNRPSLKLCGKGDILIGRYGASVGRICTGMDGAYNVALAKVIIPHGIDRRFVFWLLKSPVFQRPILQIERSAQNGFNKNDLSEIPVPLPPLAEQHRIVIRLENVLAHAKLAHDHLSRVPAILKRFRQAVLTAACSGRLTEDWRRMNAKSPTTLSVGSNLPEDAEWVTDLPDSWKALSFMEMFDIQGGTQPPKKLFAYQPRKGYIRLLQIRDFGDSPLPTYIADSDKWNKCSSEDVLIGRYGASVGRICTGMEGAYNVALAKLLIKAPVDPRFIYFLLRSELFQRPIVQIERSAQNGFNKNDLARIVLPLPPLEEQQETIRRVEKLLELDRTTGERVKLCVTHADKLTQSILAKAFRGELVPTEAELARREGREYEPASVLLERIKTQKASVDSGKTQPSKRTAPPGEKRRVVTV